MRSSTVTAAMALMLVRQCWKRAYKEGASSGTGHLLPPGLTCWRRPSAATHSNWPARAQPSPRAEAWATESLRAEARSASYSPADLRYPHGGKDTHDRGA